MVKGTPKNQLEAFLVLDELVRQTFLFMEDNPGHIGKRQPKIRDIDAGYDKELTDALINAGILSEGYAGVLSGQPGRLEGEIVDREYQLTIYVIKGKNPWEEKGRINANLHINLQKGIGPGFRYAVGEYIVDPPWTVTFEEAHTTHVGLSEFRRVIRINQTAGIQESATAPSGPTELGFSYILTLGNDNYTGNADRVMLVWHQVEAIAANGYREANYPGLKVDLAVCKNPNNQLDAIGTEKGLIYSFF